MSEQIICDDCGEVIDVTQDHYQLTGSKVKVDANNVLTTVDPPVTLHYHEEHLPMYKLAGEPVEGLPANPATPKPPTEEPTEPVIEPTPEEPTEVQL
jgi:hypothetical protein